MTDREIIQQALDALDALERYQVKRQDFDRFADEVAALHERLAQPEKGPVAWGSFFKRYCPWLAQPEQESFLPEAISTTQAAWKMGYDAAKAEQSEKELVIDCPRCGHCCPQSKPLTDEQIKDHRLALGYDFEDLPDPWDFKQGVRAAERAHGIKENT